MDDFPVMYIFVNNDLKLEKGKTANQVGHVVHLITDHLVRAIYELPKISEECKLYMKWKYQHFSRL